MLSRINKLTLFALLLIMPFIFHLSIASAIGISGVDITDSGQIKIDKDVSVTLPDDDKDGLSETTVSQVNEGVSQTKLKISFFMGLCTLCLVIIWFYKIFTFAKSSSDASERKKAMGSLITLGIATALLTGATFFFTFASSLFA